MNVTISIADDLAARAREVAKREGTTLNEIIRRHLECIAGQRSGAVVAKDLRQLWMRIQAPSTSELNKLWRPRFSMAMASWLA